MDEPHRVSVPRAQPTLVVVGKELGLIGGHVHVDRALALATLARKAKVERLLHAPVAPAVAQRFALQHLEEQVRSAARGMHLLQGHHVARAHGAVLVLAALANAHAAARGLGEAGIVLREGEVRLWLERAVLGTQPQVLVDAVGPYHLARVHLPVRVPDRLELVESVDEILAVHEGQELRLALPVAVLTRQGATVRDHQVRGLGHEAPVLRDAFARLQVELDARMHAALAEVAIQRALEAVPVELLAKLAQIAPQPLGRNGGVFPAFPRFLAVGEPRGGAQTSLAHLPQLLLVLLVVEQLHRGAAREAGHQRARFRVRLRLRVAAEFDQEPSFPFGQQLRVLRVDLHPLHVGDEHVVEPLAADRLRLHHFGDVVAGVVDVLVPEHQERPATRARHEPHRRLQHHRARPLATDERAGDVEAFLGKELRQVVSRDAARDVRKASADLLAVSIAQVAQAAVDLAAAASGGDDALELFPGRGAHRQAGTVVQDDLQLLHVVGGAASHHRVHAAGVVANHASQRAVVVRRGIGSEGEVPLLRLVAERVEHQAGLHARAPVLVVDLEDAVQVLRAVDDDRHIAALPGQAGATATHRDGRAKVARRGHCLHHVLHAARHHHPDGDLPVVGAIRRVEGAAAVVESHLAPHPAAQLALQRPRVDLLPARRGARAIADQGLQFHRAAPLRSN